MGANRIAELAADYAAATAYTRHPREHADQIRQVLAAATK